MSTSPRPLDEEIRLHAPEVAESGQPRMATWDYEVYGHRVMVSHWDKESDVPTELRDHARRGSFGTGVLMVTPLD